MPAGQHADSLGAIIPETEHDDIRRLAGVGLSPEKIAAALELPPENAAAFSALAKVPGSPVARLFDEGRAICESTPQLKLLAAAQAGNVDAVKTLQKIQERNRLRAFMENMDDDEFDP